MGASELLLPLYYLLKVHNQQQVKNDRHGGAIRNLIQGDGENLTEEQQRVDIPPCLKVSGVMASLRGLPCLMSFKRSAGRLSALDTMSTRALNCRREPRSQVIVVHVKP